VIASSPVPRRARRARLAAAALAAAFLVTSCTTDGDVVGLQDGEEVTEADVIESLDADGDGVVRRRDVQAAISDIKINQYLVQPDLVAALFPGGEIRVADVLASLEAEPPTTLGSDAEPSRAMVVARLTSMIQLRLAALSLTEFGFPVSIDGTDAEINAQVAGHLDADFEQFATEESVRRRPEIERIATPHCLSVLTVGSEAEAIAARERVASGEDVAQVAVELNITVAAPPGGAIGCNTLLDWSNAPGLDTFELQELEVGGLTSVSSMPFDGTPNNELWLVFHLDELLTDEINLAPLGPFTPGIMREQMSLYSVEVSAGFGQWNPAELAVGFQPQG